MEVDTLQRLMIKVDEIQEKITDGEYLDLCKMIKGLHDMIEIEEDEPEDEEDLLTEHFYMNTTLAERRYVVSLSVHDFMLSFRRSCLKRQVPAPLLSAVEHFCDKLFDSGTVEHPVEYVGHLRRLMILNREKLTEVEYYIWKQLMIKLDEIGPYDDKFDIDFVSLMIDNCMVWPELNEEDDMTLYNVLIRIAYYKKQPYNIAHFNHMIAGSKILVSLNDELAKSNSSNILARYVMGKVSKQFADDLRNMELRST